jgi:hypothetical protein
METTPKEVKGVFNYVKRFFPELELVVFNRQGQWNYMDADMKSISFSNTNIDEGILSSAVDSITEFPFVYQPKGVLDEDKETDNNVLIAEFLQYKFDVGCGMFYIPFLKEDFNCDAMKFSYDWNWIMKAVEHINLLDDYEYSVTILTMDCEIKNSKMETIVSIDCQYNPDELINSVYEAVVGFVKWYNEQNK